MITRYRPVDHVGVGPFMDSMEHLRQLEQKRCTHVEGSIVLRCNDRCKVKVRYAYALLGADASQTPHIDDVIKLECVLDEISNSSIDAIVDEKKRVCNQGNVRVDASRCGMSFAMLQATAGVRVYARYLRLSLESASGAGGNGRRSFRI